MLQIDKYASMNGWHHVHPLEKAIFSFSFLLFSTLTKSITIALITFFVMGASILFGAKIPFRYYVRLLALPLFFLLTSVLVIIVSIAPIESDSARFSLACRARCLATICQPRQPLSSITNRLYCDGKCQLYVFIYFNDTSSSNHLVTAKSKATSSCSLNC